MKFIKYILDKYREQNEEKLLFKLFSFSFSDEDDFQKIVNVFSIKLKDPQSYFKYEFSIYKDYFNLANHC